MLSINDLSIRIAGRLLIEDSTVQIHPGARVGLVGRNGAGKSTLFQAICGDLAPESGKITLPPRWRIGRLAQEAPDGPDSLISVVLRADVERTALLQEAESATDPHRIADIQTRLADIGAHSAPARAAAILEGLGFPAADQLRACAEFSGGWRMRVGLAATLFSEPDLLLLDEPTNYLDLEGTLWLEDHLAHYPRTVIVVSHDRDLLESSVDQILHLERKKLTLYKGTYSSFERQRAERIVLDAKHAKKQDAQRKHLEAFVERFRAKATKARQAQSRLKLLAKMQPVSALVNDEVRPIHFPKPERTLSPPIIAADHVAIGYDPAKPVLTNVTLRLDNDDRIALLGANGNGKSTLIKLLAGKLAPFSGNVTRADRMVIAYFAQHQLDELNPLATPYDHVRKLMSDAPESRIRARAGSIGFPDKMADTKVAQLSGGEKARLLLGLATFHGPNLIILDEPTNHLDIDSRAALADAINDFPGAVIMVSHDRYLIESCADRLWLVAHGKVAAFDGDIDDYRRFILNERRGGAGTDSAGVKEQATVQGNAQRRASAKSRAELAPLRQAAREAEAEIARIQSIIEKIDVALALPDLFSRDPDKAAQLSKARANANAALEKAEDEWLAVSAQIEDANAAQGAD